VQQTHSASAVRALERYGPLLGDALCGTRVAVIGASGYLGGQLTGLLQMLAENGQGPTHVQAVSRRIPASGGVVEGVHFDEFVAARGSVDHLIDCAGMTGDFRERPLDTIEAHVCVPVRLLSTIECHSSFVFTSSSRVYAFLSEQNGAWEEDAVVSSPHLTIDAVYDDSKRLGETACHAMVQVGVPCKIARLSNVVSEELPIDGALAVSALFAGVDRGVVPLYGAAEIEKDFCDLADALGGLLLIATRGAIGGVFNIASGVSVSTRQVADWVSEVTGLPVVEEPSYTAYPRLVSRLSTARSVAELGYSPETDLRGVFQRIARARQRGTGAPNQSTLG